MTMMMILQGDHDHDHDVVVAADVDVDDDAIAQGRLVCTPPSWWDLESVWGDHSRPQKKPPRPSHKFLCTFPSLLWLLFGVVTQGYPKTEGHVTIFLAAVLFYLTWLLVQVQWKTRIIQTNSNKQKWNFWEHTMELVDLDWLYFSCMYLKQDDGDGCLK